VPSGPVQKLVEIKYATPQLLNDFLQCYGVTMTKTPVPNKIVLMGLPENVATAEGALAQVDVPEAAPKDVQVTVYLVKGFNVPQGEEGPSKPLPAAIKDCVADLQGVFEYNGYQLVDTVLLRCREGGQISGSGFMPSKADEPPTLCRIAADQVSIQRAPEAPIVRIRQFTCSAEVPFPVGQANAPQGAPRQIQWKSVGIQADIDVEAGHCAVAGNADFIPGDEALFAIVTAQVVAP
jgi:hypothetical protein